MFSALPIPQKVAVALEALPIRSFAYYGMRELSYGAIVLDSSGQHALVLGEQQYAFTTLTPAQQAFLLLHEYTHLAFGHTLRAARLKLDGALWNIATDAWINEAHPHNMTDSLGGVYYTKLREQVPELPEWLLDPLTIYRILEAQQAKVENTLDQMVAQPLQDGHAVGQASVEVLKARKTLMEAAQDDPSLQALAGELTYSGQSAARANYIAVDVAHWLEAIYQQVNHLASKKQGDLQRERGWRRPGRVPGVAGSTRRPPLHVMLALDVSGSTTAWWPAIIAARRGLSQLHDVEIVCHAEDIVFRGSAIPLNAPVGGGTDFTPVVKAATTCKPDCLIWITDGQASKVTLPPCPIYWVWLPGSAKWTLRPGDFQTEYV